MNIGVLGSGFIIPYFIDATKKVEGYHLRGLWARNQEKREALAADFEYVTGDLDQLLNDPQIDVIYVGLPNGLHYEYSKKALLAGKSVIVEKPFVVSVEQAEELFAIGKEKGLFVFEAIMTKFQPNYVQAKPYVEKLGDIKIVEGNFSQYSRRYDKFKSGIILPAFSKELAGGSLMDLGVYNIHYVVGLFGKPEKVAYFPNVLKGVDTSGVLVLDYGTFKATLVNAKDCGAESFVTVQGDKGYMRCNGTSSRCQNIDIILNDKTSTRIGNDVVAEMGGMKVELEEFIDMYSKNDLDRCWRYSQETLIVQWILESAIKFAGLEYK